MVTPYIGKSSGNTILQAKCCLPGQMGIRFSANPSNGGWVIVEVKRETDTCANHSNLTTV